LKLLKAEIPEKQLQRFHKLVPVRSGQRQLDDAHAFGGRQAWGAGDPQLINEAQACKIAGS
jgi:hypothetical protein